MSSPLNVHLEAYEGPLDLLLDLIRKQQINIHDIPIAKITSQYLEYMQRAAGMSIELSAEFVYMAATLIHIKSKTLLPRDPELEKIAPEEDPRQELVDRLLEHERFKDAAEMLQQKRMIEEAVWSNSQIDQFLADSEEPGLAVTLHDLVKTLQKVLDRAKLKPQYQVTTEDVTVPEMIVFLRKSMKQLRTGETISAVELFERARSRRAVICLFLAMLEMVRMQAVSLTQKELFGEILLKKHKGFDDLEANEQALETIQEEYS
ncbi:MAG: segregation/condensation protein A [Bryobacterales bacterium]|nr:segregation/condensation protein A [Bryobacterales bacterium]